MHITRIIQLFSQVISWNSTMSACERAQQWQMCLELLREMRQDAAVFRDEPGPGLATDCVVLLLKTGKRW
jgi:pentatricopeptide repeat protein